MVKDRELEEHKEWLGFLQPVGLVVSPIALNNAQMLVNRNVVDLQRRLRVMMDFQDLTQEILGWESTNLVEPPEELTVSLGEYGELLEPSYAVPHPSGEGWLMLVKVIDSAVDMDSVTAVVKGTGWQATPQAKLERLLRETGISIGILYNGEALRLVYAPRGESSGFLTFPMSAMGEVSGRLILGAMEMLLSRERVFNAPVQRGLMDVLEDSRKYQNQVSTQLSEQVLQAFNELLTGFECASKQSNSNFLDTLIQTSVNDIYNGLVTVLLRLLFLLYAEDNGLMPTDSIYSDNYSVLGLYEQLATDAPVYQDVMAQRYGAWAWLLSLFALVYEGLNDKNMFLPARKGDLFNPNTYPFLTGLEGDDIPLVADGTIYQVLRYLLIINGDRISYRSLDVEHLGSVYESLMGYRIAVKNNSLCLVAGDERRSTGSHYTPRDLTEQIVKETLKPVLFRLGSHPTPDAILDIKVCDIAMGSGAFLVESCRQLADVLVQAWIYHGMPKDVSEDEVMVYARRLVAQKCLYGVDKNPFAVTLGKMSLWLITLSKHLPFTFLDHAIKCGDSLVGLTREHINNFTWEHKPEQLDNYLELPLFKSLNVVTSNRQDISAGFNNYQQQSLFYQNNEVLLKDIRHQGELIVNAFFSADKPKARLTLLNQVRNGNNLNAIKINSPLNAFNWEIEFPEVFDRHNPGFDVIVGNPPFLGGLKISTYLGDAYLQWLKHIHPNSHGNADLAAHFFRRAFYLLREGGCFGLIATNTISQGDTRETGLAYICENGGKIYHAKTRYKWPGVAAVIVSIVHVVKEAVNDSPLLAENIKTAAVSNLTLDNESVNHISAYLVNVKNNKTPKKLLANANKSFMGSIVLGMGFTFDDTSSKGTSIAEMNRLIELNPNNSKCIFPYIGGEEVNTSPTHAYHRYVINFGDLSEDEARQYPDLMKIVEEKVKPERLAQKRKALSLKWWQHAEKRPGLYNTITGLNRVLAAPIVTKHLSFVFLPPNMVYSHALYIFAFDTYNIFAILQSQVHEVWARFFGSSLKDDLNYSATDTFETFPFPIGWEAIELLEETGKEYYEYRASLMVENNQGLTVLYNRYHNPEEMDSEIERLRELHLEMDRAVLSAYGWNDIEPVYEFSLENEESSEKGMKPWRYGWNKGSKNKVLNRLWEMNEERYEQEVISGGVKPLLVPVAKGGDKKKRGR